MLPLLLPVLLAVTAEDLTPDLQRELVLELLSSDPTLLHPAPPKPVSLAAAAILASAPVPLTPLGEEEGGDNTGGTPLAVVHMSTQQRRAVCQLGTDSRCAGVAEALAIPDPAKVCAFFGRLAEPTGQPRAAFCHGLADALELPASGSAAPPAQAPTPRPALDTAALCTDTAARVLPTARSLEQARSWSGKIAAECEAAAAQRSEPADVAAKVCWELDGRLSMALEQGFEAHATGQPDPYADEKPSAFCARFAEATVRAPLLSKGAEQPSRVLETPVLETPGKQAVAEKPVAKGAEEPKLVAKAVEAPKPEAKAEEPKPAAKAAEEPKALVRVVEKPTPAAKVVDKPKPAATAVEEPKAAPKAVEQPPPAPADPQEAGLVALLRALADQHALERQCTALTTGLASSAADTAELAGAPLEQALAFNTHDQGLLEQCARDLQEGGAHVLAGLTQPGALLAMKSATTGLVLDTALDSPWATEVCSDMATSFLRSAAAARKSFCSSYQAHFTHDDVAVLRRKPLRPVSQLADAEAASKTAGSRFLEDALRGAAHGAGSNAAAVLWELQAPLPASLLETHGKTESRTALGASFWRK